MEAERDTTVATLINEWIERKQSEKTELGRNPMNKQHKGSSWSRSGAFR